MINRRERVPEFSGLPEQEKSNKRMTIELAPEQEKGLDDFLEQQDKKFEKLKPSKLKKTLRNIAVGAALVATVWGIAGCSGSERDKRDVREQTRMKRPEIAQKLMAQQEKANKAIKAEVQEAQSFLEEQRTRVMGLLEKLAVIPNQPPAGTERESWLLQNEIAQNYIIDFFVEQAVEEKKDLEEIASSKSLTNEHIYHTLNIINGYIPDFADKVYGNNDGRCDNKEAEKFNQDATGLPGFQTLSALTFCIRDEVEGNK